MQDFLVLLAENQKLGGLLWIQSITHMGVVRNLLDFNEHPGVDPRKVNNFKLLLVWNLQN